MKSFIKENTRSIFITLLLSFTTATVANAQRVSRDSSMMMDKMEPQQMSYTIPQKPEDISPLLNGEKIPKAILTDLSGKKFDLNKAVSEKPTVLVFYRGGWCPYCSRQLSGLQQAAPDLEKLGYQLIAISTDTPEELMQSATKEKLDYTLLSDADLSLSKQFGIAYKAPEAYWNMLPKTTGGLDTALLLPVPSVFILDKKGTIHFEYINPDFKQRLSADLLKAVTNSIRKDL
ncbi:peroxiredoxin-like family protein [Chitinophaga pinensis]|uniref:thioredoxin-dependent peroxiredoxin n=1 Tax=Chitinophaga pinensis (strain ATCC 43595 / DSM 2588 / LMG 13176 / NBRC 15968 / NCIMB 11800 / UQM 2034) TaxID=485918 RepID=A0A979GU14_CHIPD|nr:peroxiredoxin-like family protein [Chitinophaga pinensis]ACU60499.1 alkyl hydroperoxide reductase/ Thiol specific antioxidant/ Mal allergen [Chitinophaga pinensis DSM 2588]